MIIIVKEITKELDAYISNGGKILVGDAPGVDRQVQNYLNNKGYNNVVVYGPGKEVRYSANKNWKTKPVDAPEYETGSKEWLAKKDIAMANDADQGLAVVLDEGAKATRKNVERLIDQHKDVNVFMLNKNGAPHDKWTDPERLNAKDKRLNEDYGSNRNFSAKSRNGDTLTMEEIKRGPIAKMIEKVSKNSAEEMEKSAIFNIKLDGKKVGELQLYHEGDNSVNGVWLDINEKERGKGYATAALSAALNECKKRGYKSFTLEVPGNSPDARHIYEKMGFKVVKELSSADDDYVWGGLTAMELDLTKWK